MNQPRRFSWIIHNRESCHSLIEFLPGRPLKRKHVNSRKPCEKLCPSKEVSLLLLLQLAPSDDLFQSWGPPSPCPTRPAPPGPRAGCCREGDSRCPPWCVPVSVSGVPLTLMLQLQLVEAGSGRLGLHWPVSRSSHDLHWLQTLQTQDWEDRLHRTEFS